MRELFDLAWKRLLVITSVIGDAQGRLIATLFYFTILVPFGIGARLFTDPLQQRHAGQPTTWLQRHELSTSLDDARRQG
jgi:hypothetical protein